MGVSKKAIFYADYNDLALSAATFSVPALIMIVGSNFIGNPKIVMWLALVIFFGLFIRMLITTYKANDGKIFHLTIMSISKLVLSFIYIIYLYDSMAAKKRTDRGKAMFILVILTPILYALVHEKEGVFKLSSRGRPVSSG